MRVALIIWSICALLAVLHVGVLGQTCTESDKTAAAATATSFPSQFFSCYDADRLSLASCFINATQVSAQCSACFQIASQCVFTNCGSVCVSTPKTPGCVTCAKDSCQASLDTCAGTGVFSFDPCTSFFCNQPAWVLPVIIAGSVLGFVLILIVVYVLVRRGGSSDEGCCSCCAGLSLTACCSCFGSNLKDEQRIEERLRRQNQERIERLNMTRDASSAASAARNGKQAQQQVGMEFPNKDDDFEMGFSQETPKKNDPSYEEWGGKQAIVDKREHNVRASKLPEGFRIQSVQPGLTPDMIFNMDTYTSMAEANKAAAAVPAAVIASHKALKMMGVREAEVQKPFSESVTSRVERIAKAANSQGLMVGGATANLGGQVAEQFAIKRKAAEERAEAFRQAQLKKEEARIRAEIKAENQDELQEKRRTLRQSQKLSPEESKRLSLAAAARRSAKAAQNTAAAAGNKLKDFLDKTEKS